MLRCYGWRKRIRSSKNFSWCGGSYFNSQEQNLNTTIRLVLLFGIHHLTIKNAAIGILVEGIPNSGTPTLTLSNSKIYNSSSVNLWARTATIEGSNLVLGNAGAISLYCNLGGSYAFTHTTIANYWSKSFRSGEALRIDNVVDFQNGQIRTGDLTRADFTNSIIDGNSFVELALIRNDNNDFSFSFTNCLIQFNDTSGALDGNPLYDFENSAFYSTIFLNEDTEFQDTSKNDFRLEEGSAARSKAQQVAAELIPTDILGIDRTTDPAVGAYQYSPDNWVLPVQFKNQCAEVCAIPVGSAIFFRWQ